MSSTLNITFQIKGTVGNQLIEFPTEGMFAPKSLTISNDLHFLKKASVANATATEILTIGSGDDVSAATLIVLIPSVDMTFCWECSAATENSNAGCEAGTPFILSTGTAAPYNATPDTSVAGTLEAITEITAYQSSGSAASVLIFVAN